jgi:hypothetical protein
MREEVDLGQIQVPAQGFDIVNEVVAPVGGGVLRGCGVAGSPEVQEYEGAVFGPRPTTEGDKVLFSRLRGVPEGGLDC